VTSNLLKTAKLRRNGAGEEISPEVKAVVRLITRSTVSVAAREVPEAPKSVEASESAREGGGGRRGRVANVSVASSTL
jgi:hypothetical protein